MGTNGFWIFKDGGKWFVGQGSGATMTRFPRAYASKSSAREAMEIAAEAARNAQIEAS